MRVFKTLSVLILITVSNPNIALSQDHFRSIILDAIELREYVTIDNDTLIFKRNNINHVIELFSNYSPSDERQEILKKLHTSPFFKLGNDLIDEIYFETFETVPRNNLLASAGSMDVTNLAYGLTDFLIDRTKTELNIDFFRKFKNAVDKNDDLQTLFPETTDLFNVIDNEIYNYNLFLQSLRYAFETDLKRMTSQIEKWLVNNENQISDKDLLSILKISLSTFVSLTEQQQPGKIINDFADQLYVTSFEKDAFKHLKSSIQITSFLSESFRDTLDSQRFWVSSNEIRKLSNPVTLRIFLGLLYQECVANGRDITVTGNVKLSDVLEEIGDKWATHQQSISDLVTTVSSQLLVIENRVEALIETGKLTRESNELSSEERRRLMLNAYFDVSSSMFDFLKDVPPKLTGLPKLENTFSADKIDEFQAIISKIQTSQKIAVYVTNRQYTGAISLAYSLLNEFKASDESEVWQKFLKYGTFMTNLVEADSPEAVTSAIEASAAPPGSYSIKRHSSFSIALNGYVGVFGGAEIIDVDENSERAFNPSITVPVGVSFNWGRKGIFPTGAFVSLIDFGTIASYRFSSEETSTQPEIRLKNIVSPGFSFEWGLENTPLSFSIGYQLGPQLRSIESDDIILGDIYHRIGGTLKVDIPIFYFHH